MDARRGSEPTPAKNRTTVERKSEREFVVKRTFDAPARLVFEAWTQPELLKQWWAPKSMGMSLVSCEADVRVGGGYRFVFGLEASKTMAFFGRYTEDGLLDAKGRLRRGSSIRRQPFASPQRG